MTTSLTLKYEFQLHTFPRETWIASTYPPLYVKIKTARRRDNLSSCAANEAVLADDSRLFPQFPSISPFRVLKFQNPLSKNLTLFACTGCHKNCTAPEKAIKTQQSSTFPASPIDTFTNVLEKKIHGTAFANKQPKSVDHAYPHTAFQMYFSLFILPQ